MELVADGDTSGDMDAVVVRPKSGKNSAMEAYYAAQRQSQQHFQLEEDSYE
jgi:hypothetical protein